MSGLFVLVKIILPIVGMDGPGNCIKLIGGADLVIMVMKPGGLVAALAALSLLKNEQLICLCNSFYSCKGQHSRIPDCVGIFVRGTDERRKEAICWSTWKSIWMCCSPPVAVK